MLLPNHFVMATAGNNPIIDVRSGALYLPTGLGRSGSQAASRRLFNQVRDGNLHSRSPRTAHIKASINVMTTSGRGSNARKIVQRVDEMIP